MLTVTSFHATDIAANQRVSAWNAFLAALRAKCVADASPENFAASFSARATPWGFAIATLAISPQRLTIDTRPAAGGIWLAHIVEGHGTLKTERGSVAFSAGELIYGKAPRELSLTAPGWRPCQPPWLPRR